MQREAKMPIFETQKKSKKPVNKRTKVALKIQELAKQYNMDIFFCIQDKKSKAFSQHSTDENRFGTD